LRIYWHALCSALAAAAAETGKDVLRKELPCAVDSRFPLCYYQCLMLSRENGKVIVPLVARVSSYVRTSSQHKRFFRTKFETWK
jgi:hypothetical protein